MAHRCVHCSKIIATGSKEVLEGCGKCGGHFFLYVKDELLNKIDEISIEIPSNEKKKIEEDIREMAGISNQTSPVILDIESIRVIGEGKYEIDIINLFNKKKPVVYKLEEGKYIIDLSSLRNDIKKED